MDNASPINMFMFGDFAEARILECGRILQEEKCAIGLTN